MNSIARRLRQRPLLAAASAAAVLAGGGSTYLLLSHRSTAPTLPFAPLRRDGAGKIIPPSFPRTKTRHEHVSDLRASALAPGQVYDLVVVGGGATGSGIALDAATRGLKVALLERDDFSAGTSSKSTKLVHGGVRYLEKAVWNLDYGQLQLVMEALRERKTFLEIAPHLARTLQIILPVSRWWQLPYFYSGTVAYDMLAGSQGIGGGSYLMSRRKALEAFPQLAGDKIVGALVYYDGQHNDAKMNVSLALTAALYGASIANHMPVTGLEKDNDGKICGVRVKDSLSKDNGNDDDFVVRAKGVINATGPFSDAIEKMDDPSSPDRIVASSGAHVILPSTVGPKDMGLLDPSTSDGRVVFLLPWEGKFLAGTTDNGCELEQNPKAKEEEIDFILTEVKKFLSADTPVSRKDVLAAWSGIRPLVRDPAAKKKGTTESLVRSHLITVSKSGLLTCTGGKWTTYRQMAEDAVDEAVRTFNLHRPRPNLPFPADVSGTGIPSDVSLPATDGAKKKNIPVPLAMCKTRNIKLVGAHGYSPSLPLHLQERFPQMAPDIANHLAGTYGDRAWQVAEGGANDDAQPLDRILPAHPYVVGEVVHAARHELAQTAPDVLARRTRLAFLDADAALDALPVVIDVMGRELGWDSRRRGREWDDAVRFLGSMGLGEDRMGWSREEVVKGLHRRAVEGGGQEGRKRVEGKGKKDGVFLGAGTAVA